MCLGAVLCGLLMGNIILNDSEERSIYAIRGNDALLALFALGTIGCVIGCRWLFEIDTPWLSILVNIVVNFLIATVFWVIGIFTIVFWQICKRL